MAAPSTSGTTCGTWLWRDATRKSWRCCLRLPLPTSFGAASLTFFICLFLLHYAIWRPMMIFLPPPPPPPVSLLHIALVNLILTTRNMMQKTCLSRSLVQQTCLDLIQLFI